MISEDTSKIDWARILLDETTDDMIINVSREKIAHELIKLRTEVKNLKSGLIESSKNINSEQAI